MSPTLFHIRWAYRELRVELLVVQAVTRLNVILAPGQDRKFVRLATLDKIVGDSWVSDVWTLHVDRVAEYQARIRSRAVVHLEHELDQLEKILRRTRDDPFRIIEPEVRAKMNDPLHLVESEERV